MTWPRAGYHVSLGEGPTHLADPAEAEVALQDEVKLLLDAEGGDVTSEPQAVSNGTVLGRETYSQAIGR